MDIEIAKKYLPEGKTHLIEEQLTDEELAVMVDAFLFKDGIYQTEKDKAIHYLMKKEIAYQVIRRLAGDKEIPGVIQNEMDWMWYFQFENPGGLLEKKQWIERTFGR